MTFMFTFPHPLERRISEVADYTGGKHLNKLEIRFKYSLIKHLFFTLTQLFKDQSDR